MQLHEVIAVGRATVGTEADGYHWAHAACHKQGHSLKWKGPICTTAESSSRGCSLRRPLKGADCSRWLFLTKQNSALLLSPTHLWLCGDLYLCHVFLKAFKWVLWDCGLARLSWVLWYLGFLVAPQRKLQKVGLCMVFCSWRLLSSVSCPWSDSSKSSSDSEHEGQLH